MKVNKESQFFCINTENSWKEGFYENVEIKEGIKILETYKYIVYKKIDQKVHSKLNTILDYCSEKNGFVYYIDIDGLLYQYDYLTNELIELYKIDLKGKILKLQIVQNKLYMLFKENDLCSFKIYSIRTGELLKELKLKLKKVVDCTINMYGHAFILQEDMEITWINIENDQINKFNVYKFIEEAENKTNKLADIDKRFTIGVHKDEILAIVDKEGEYLKLIDFQDINNLKLINTFNEAKFLTVVFTGEGNLITSADNKGKIGLYYCEDYKNLFFIQYFKSNVKNIKVDSYGRIYLLNDENIMYVLKKEIRIKELDFYNIYSGIYYSKIFDSNISEMKWHKIKIDASIPKDTQIKINYYAFDNTKVLFNEKNLEIKDMFKDFSLNFMDIENYFKNLWNEEIINPKEALFQKAKGRYLLLKIELIGREKITPQINNIRVYYNRTSYLRYLPEIYQSNVEGDDFLERYLSIFEAFYMDIEEKIDFISNCFDIDKTNSVFLKWLCEWLGLEEYRNWEDCKIRSLLKNASFLHRKRGTKIGIEKILEIYLGVKPIIIENFEVQNIDKGNSELKKIIENLYGSNPFAYTVLINLERDLTIEELECVNKILKNVSPAYCEYNVIVLKPWLFLDKQSYLGINSVVSGYLPLKLDGKAILPYNAVLIDETDE